MLDVVGSQVVVEVVEVVYHYITMPSRVQHAMITSLHFSPPGGSEQTQCPSSASYLQYHFVAAKREGNLTTDLSQRTTTKCSPERIFTTGSFCLENFTTLLHSVKKVFRNDVISQDCGLDFAFVTELNFVRKINEILVKISVTLLRAQIAVPARIQGT